MSLATANKLTVTLPSDREIVLTRTFNAPRELVFEAWTRPEHVRQWWGCRGSTLTVCEIDLRVGGAYRFVTRMPDGNEYPFKGEHLEIVRPERLVCTQVLDAEPFRNYPAVLTATFEDLGGRTLFTGTVLHESKESRDAHVGSGMESGAAESYDRLEELLEGLS